MPEKTKQDELDYYLDLLKKSPAKRTADKIEYIKNLIKEAGFLKIKMPDVLKLPVRSVDKLKKVQEAGNYNQKFMEMAGQAILKSPKKPLPVSTWDAAKVKAFKETIKK